MIGKGKQVYTAQTLAVNQGNYSKPCSEQRTKRKYLSRVNITKPINCHVTT